MLLSRKEAWNNQYDQRDREAGRDSECHEQALLAVAKVAVCLRPGTLPSKVIVGWGVGFPSRKERPMNQRNKRKDVTLSIIHLLDVIAAGAAVLICLGVGAASVGRWLLGG